LARVRCGVRSVKILLTVGREGEFLLAFGSGVSTLPFDLKSPLKIAVKIAGACVALVVLVSATALVRGRWTQPQTGERALGSLKDTLEPKIGVEWTAFKNKDPKAYGELLADDFIAVEVDGEGTRNKAQAVREIERSNVTEFTLALIDVHPLGDDVAMVTYEVFLQFPPSAQVRFLRVYVTEIWQKQGQDWKALHYQETRVK
jgi:ketosteroid isomerase-like protein